MKKYCQIALMAYAAWFYTGLAYADNYIIDTKGAHASINFKFKHLNFSWLTGAFKKFEGQFSWDPNKPEASKISVTIDTRSLDSNHAERDKRIRSEKYLDVKKYPTASFVSTAFKDQQHGMFELTGDLTLHGVTKQIVIDVETIAEGKDPWGGYRAGFEGEVTLNTTDFGMNNFLPGNEVVMQLYIEGVKQ